MIWLAVGAFLLPLLFYLYQHNRHTDRQKRRLDAIQKRLKEKEDQPEKGVQDLPEDEQ